MASIGTVLYFNSVRKFSTTTTCCGLKNFRKIVLHGFRGSRRFKEKQKTDPDPDIPIYDYGVRQPGYTKNGKFHLVPEMIPEIIVPDLTNFELKPYVSYRVSDVYQEEFTAKELFLAIYSEKIGIDYKKKKLDENGNSLEPNSYELLDAEKAKEMARRAGSDIFDSDPPPPPPEVEGIIKI